jgi:glutamyl/glutaminyl-tRNA synthetase
VVNYLSLLGWSSPSGEEVISREELVAQISLDRVRTSDTIFDPEKLRWLSGQHLGRLTTGDLAAAASAFIDAERFPLSGERLEWAVEALRPRLLTLEEGNEYLERFFFPLEDAQLDRVRNEVRDDLGASDVLRALGKALHREGEWVPGSLSKALRDTGKEIGARGPALFHPIRVAVTGQDSGPDLGLILAALGRDEVLARIYATLGTP